jgi:hypothetical protein
VHTQIHSDYFNEILWEIRLMGGLGSGNKTSSSSQATTDLSMAFDIRFVRRQGFLKAGASGSFKWKVNGEQIGAISFHTSQTSIVLSYLIDQSESVKQAIRLDETACNLGGYRKWFCCQKCSRRCEVLYYRYSRFHCRTCQNLTYETQSQSKLDRMIRRYHKLQDKMFDEDSYSKKKGIHLRTYHKLWDEYLALDEAIDQRICGLESKL